MDKQKLLRIILKDLEELTFLSEEINANEDDSTLIIDLALSKAKLLCQEIEVLKEISAPAKKIQENDEEDEEELVVVIETSELENEEIVVEDPELEILNFEDHESIEEEQIEEESVENEVEVEDVPEEIEEPQEESTEEEELEDIVESNEEITYEPTFSTEETDEDIEQDEDEEDDLEEDIDDDLDEEDLETEEEIEDELESVEEIEEEDTKSESEATVLDEDNIELDKAEFREITIDDDDEIDTIQFPTQSTTFERPVMREIPKPEDPEEEKSVVGEKFQKERSINDAIGEKATEPKLTNGPISNLRAAIGLNDRFLFIREIFDNNAEKYNMVIENLDKLETIQQAVEYLKANLALQKNDTSMKFVELLKRRFTK